MDPSQSLAVAEEIGALLDQLGQPVVLIGALALAAHGYVRETRDLDLGTNATVPQLRELAGTLGRRGYAVELREPDGSDPLGGVLDVSGPFGMVQVVSFGTTFPAVILDALASATHTVTPDSALRVVPLEQLVALKLYAGGHKSRSDVAELLARTPDLDLGKLRAVCARYRLSRQLEAVLQFD